MNSPKSIEIIADSARGVYIPQHFAETCSHWSGVDQDEFRILNRGPDNVHYWDVWNTVIDNAYYIEEATGRKFVLHSGECGDLFAICEAELTEEEKQNLFGEY